MRGDEVERNECQCESCKRACLHNPGWFMPGEAERAAELSGLSLHEFFKKHLVVDYWSAEDPTFVLKPATVRDDPGEMATPDPRGACALFRDGLCSIHAAKPHECAVYDHTSTDEKRHVVRAELVAAWSKPAARAQLTELLGYEPYEHDLSFAEMMGLIY